MGSLDRRTRAGIFVSSVGIALNLLLSAGKIAVGFLFGLVSVIADGFNNVSDCGSGVVSLVSFYISEKPADREHPFGHHRAEYLAAMVTGFLVLFLAAETLRESISRIVDGAAGESASWVVFLVLGISIALKAAMSVFYRISAKKLGSDALKAASLDSLCDCVATAAVLAGVGFSRLALPADGWAGIVVSLFIAWQGIRILKDASSQLLGHAPDPALVKEIGDTIMGTAGVLGFHDLQIYNYGRGASFATVHVEMDASVPALDAHSVIDGIENCVREGTGVVLTVHSDPVDLKDKEAARLAAAVREAAKVITEGLELHDFRLIPGTRRVVFDAGIPYSCKLSDEELRSRLASAVRKFGDYEPTIRIERE